MKGMLMTVALALAAAAAGALPSEIEVKLVLHCREYVQGERIRAVVDIANSSGETIAVTNAPWADRLFVELFRASDNYRYENRSKRPFTAAFVLEPGEGQKLETFLGEHYSFDAVSHYLARAVLVHAGTRFESSLKSFDLVPGVRVGGAMQMFKSRPGLKREFELVCWNRGRVEHLFLKAKDDRGRRWTTADLGSVLRVTAPRVSVQGDGRVITLHRATQDQFIRTEFWSLPDDFVFRENEALDDPDVAGARRIKELYMESGGVTPVKKAWWKFW